MIAVAGLTGAIALWESSLLLANGSPMNVLRLGNQAYSVSIALLILKLHRPIWPRVVNVRATTFGIYLSHSIVAAALLFLLKRSVLRSYFGQASGVIAVCVICIMFACAYGCSLALTELLRRHSSLRWMVGNFASTRSAGAPILEPQNEFLLVHRADGPVAHLAQS